MYIQQLYTGCLGEAAYYIESDGRLPSSARSGISMHISRWPLKRKASIKYILKRIFHADFVSAISI